MAKKEVKGEIAGVVLKVSMTPGETLAADDEIAIIEAMKMEIPLTTPVAGSVISVHVADGKTIGEGDLIAVIETGEPKA
jgi:biotin carboxyl carrier protein